MSLNDIDNVTQCWQICAVNEPAHDLTPEDLLKAYETEVVSQIGSKPLGDKADSGVDMVLMLMIIDNKSGRWGRDFFVKTGKLPKPADDPKGTERTTQIRKVNRWRSKKEKEMWLPEREQGGVSQLYRRKRAKWDAANPRPTNEQLLAGWKPVQVDYSEFETPTIDPAQPEASAAAAASQTKTPKPPSAATLPAPGIQSTPPEAPAAASAPTVPPANIPDQEPVPSLVPTATPADLDPSADETESGGSTRRKTSGKPRPSEMLQPRETVDFDERIFPPQKTMLVL